MEKEKKREVIYLPEAERNIFSISLYISQQGFPETAKRFANKLYDFGDMLGFLPGKFPICRNKILFKKGYRCAVFAGNYIFIYKARGEKVVIVNVVHAATLK